MWCYVLITWYKVLLYILHKFEQEFLLNSLYPQNKTQMQRTVIIFVIMGRITYTQTALHLIHQLPICAPNSTVSAQGQVFNVMHIHESWSFCTGVLVSSQDQAVFQALCFASWSGAGDVLNEILVCFLSHLFFNITFQLDSLSILLISLSMLPTVVPHHS